jgi:hypothetical protein
MLTRHVSSYKRQLVTLNFVALFNERTVSNDSGKSVGPRAGMPRLKSHSPWYRRMQSLLQTHTCRH